jgi:hypothetical protein
MRAEECLAMKLRKIFWLRGLIAAADTRAARRDRRFARERDRSNA